jgi:hypothetical protein
MVKISTLSGVAAAALLLGVVGATAQGARDSGAANTQPSGGGASSAQGAGGSLGAGGEKSSGGGAGTSAQTSQPRAGSGTNTQPPGGGASSAQGAGGSVGESGRSGGAAGSSAQGSSSTQTGSSASGGGSGAVTLSSEEQTKLKTSIHNVNVKQSNINIDVRTGVVLPETVTTQLEPIPAQIVEIVPRFRGYKVIRVKNEILIVEPSSRRVVYIIQS